MRRRPTGEPTALPLQPLHPSLQGVLQSLDVQLDEELARYRKARLRKTARKPGLPAVANVSRPVPPPPPPHRGLALAAAANPAPVPPLPAMPDLWEESALEAGVPTTASISNAIADESFQESSDQLLHGLSTPELENREPSELGMLSSLLTPLGIGSLLLLLLSSVTFGYLLMNPSSLWFLGENSASRSGNSGVPSTGTPPGTSSNLPTSPNLANQEFVDLNLDNLSNLPARPSPTAPVPAAMPTSPTVVGAVPLDVPASAVPAEPAVTVPRQPESEGGRETPDAPRATASESRESRPTRRVRRPRRAETTAAPELSRSSRPSQTVATPASSAPVRSPAASPAAASPAAASPVPASPASPAPAPAASTPSASPAPAVATAPAPASPRPGRYYVVTEYSGDRSLNRARRAVNDAYVRNFNSGAKVQMGVFSEAERAEELTQDLQRRGIPAQVLREGN